MNTPYIISYRSVPRLLSQTINLPLTTRLVLWGLGINQQLIIFKNVTITHTIIRYIIFGK